MFWWLLSCTLSSPSGCNSTKCTITWVTCQTWLWCSSSNKFRPPWRIIGKENVVRTGNKLCENPCLVTLENIYALSNESWMRFLWIKHDNSHYPQEKSIDGTGWWKFILVLTSSVDPASIEGLGFKLSCYICIFWPETMQAPLPFTWAQRVGSDIKLSQ